MPYLDVEGLPDREFYYLIGLLINDGTARRQVSLWADREADQRGLWDAFLAVIRGLGEEFDLFHYGSYETRFLKLMAERYGGDPEVIARLDSRGVNILSAIQGRVYFPVHANDLKSVAGCLGFGWSDAAASGLQSIVWRHEWEATGDGATKQRLLMYNQEDCFALEAVVNAVRSLGSEPAPGDGRLGPPVSGVDEIEDPTSPRKYGRTKFVLPEFAGITKCAYFDYQRDKVLCRTNPALKRSLRRKNASRSTSWRVNEEVECKRPKVCPGCGGHQLDQQSRHQKLVVDLKQFNGGVKRWVTLYKTKRYRIRHTDPILMAMVRSPRTNPSVPRGPCHGETRWQTT